MNDSADNLDSPWKDALQRYFPEFLAFFFPDAYADIDWRQSHQFLDKELQQIVREAELGRRVADVLAKVWRKGGEEAWVLVHVEVQGQQQASFPERMYVYNYRLYDRYRRPVASLAVLADENSGWRPHEFGYELWGCRTGLVFPTIKLLDYSARWTELDSSHNAFATVVMAHLKAQETKHDPVARQGWKLWLTRRLYRLGYDRQQVIDLFGIIDWVLRLPEPQALDFWQQLQAVEEEKRMRYITSVERIGMEQGLEKGLQQGLQQGLQEGKQAGIQQGQAEMVLRLLNRRFGAVPSLVAQRIRAVPSELMPDLLDVALTASVLEEVAATVEVLALDRNVTLEG